MIPVIWRSGSSPSFAFTRNTRPVHGVSLPAGVPALLRTVRYSFFNFTFGYRPHQITTWKRLIHASESKRWITEFLSQNDTFKPAERQETGGLPDENGRIRSARVIDLPFYYSVITRAQSEPFFWNDDNLAVSSRSGYATSETKSQAAIGRRASRKTTTTRQLAERPPGGNNWTAKWASGE